MPTVDDRRLNHALSIRSGMVGVWFETTPTPLRMRAATIHTVAGSCWSLTWQISCWGILEAPMAWSDFLARPVRMYI